MTRCVAYYDDDKVLVNGGWDAVAALVDRTGREPAAVVAVRDGEELPVFVVRPYTNRKEQT